MKPIVQPLVLYTKQGAIDHSEYIKQELNVMENLGDQIEVRQTLYSMPNIIQDKIIYLLLAEDIEASLSDQVDMNSNARKNIIIFGSTNSGGISTLLKFPCAGLIPSKSIMYWMWNREDSSTTSSISMSEYGLYGLKAAYDPPVFDEYCFDAYGDDKYGFFSLKREGDKYNLPLLLREYISRLLGN